VFNFALSILRIAAIGCRWAASRPHDVGELHPLPFWKPKLNCPRGDEDYPIRGVSLPPVDRRDALCRSLCQHPAPTRPLPYEVSREGARVTVECPYVMPSLIKQVMPTIRRPMRPD